MNCTDWCLRLATPRDGCPLIDVETFTVEMLVFEPPVRSSSQCHWNYGIFKEKLQEHK